MSDPTSFETKPDDTFDIPESKGSYPIPDEGTYKNAVCISAKVADSPFVTDPAGSKVLKLTWQLQETYKDDQGKDRSFWVFEKALGLKSIRPKSNLHKICNKLTGKGAESWCPKGTRKFPVGCFMGMTTDLVLVHNPSKDGTRTYTNIAAYMVSDAQRTANAALVPNQ